MTKNRYSRSNSSIIVYRYIKKNIISSISTNINSNILNASKKIKVNIHYSTFVMLLLLICVSTLQCIVALAPDLRLSTRPTVLDG